MLSAAFLAGHQLAVPPGSLVSAASPRVLTRVSQAGEHDTLGQAGGGGGLAPRTHAAQRVHPVGSTTAPSCAILLQPQVPVPRVADTVGGPHLAPLRPLYGASYETDPLLADAVQLYRRWRWRPLYAALDAVATAHAEHLGTYRLQADVYLLNGAPSAALGQLDEVLRRQAGDPHALAVSAVVRHAYGPATDAECRLQHLRTTHPELATHVQAYLSYATAATASPVPEIDATNPHAPHLLAVLGQPPHADGTPSPGLIQRLERALTLSRTFPQAAVLVCGGATRNEHAEADVMARWLVKRGVSPHRIRRDARSRDTVGNALGIVDELRTTPATRVLLVTTHTHLPRAAATVQAAARRAGVAVQVYGSGVGRRPTERELTRQRQYTYVSALRAAGLLEWRDSAGT